MIGLYDDTGARLPIVYNGLTLNSPTDTADSCYEVNNVVTSTQFTQVVEQRNDDRDGSEAYRPRKPIRIVRLEGVIRDTTPGKFFDRLNTLGSTFDPVLIRRANPTVEGFIDLTFTTPKNGIDLAAKYVARPRAMPEPVITVFQGTMQATFVIELLLKDPRRYAQAQGSRSGSGTATNGGNYPTWPIVTITMSGAGNAAYSIDKSGDTENPLVLDLSGRINGDVIVVNMETRQIILNGTVTPSLYVSGGYFDLGPGANTITVSNGTNATTVTTWNDAYAV